MLWCRTHLLNNCNPTTDRWTTSKEDGVTTDGSPEAFMSDKTTAFGRVEHVAACVGDIVHIVIQRSVNQTLQNATSHTGSRRG